jgi:hypothetical protein
MQKRLHYQENGENKGSQMGHTKKYFKKLSLLELSLIVPNLFKLNLTIQSNLS